ncbi:MAG: coenzyme F420-0:L-glutamate ligase [Dermatophilaceae bacterium]
MWALRGIPEVETGADVGMLIAHSLEASGLALEDGDVLVITSKIVSKALGLRVPGVASRRDVVAAETVRIVAERATSTGPTRIVEGRSGVVAAAAGVDASNTGPGGEILLLPHRPDEVAAKIHAEIADLHPHLRHFGVILSDTAGRPWRGGQTDFALGAHGLRVLDDYRGRVDADGRALSVTAIAVADELAAAGDLVKRKATGMPVALVRGAGVWVLPQEVRPERDPPEGESTETADRWRAGAARLLRTGPGDWFALGHVEAARAALGVEPGSARSREIGIRSVNREPLEARVRRALALAGADGADIGPKEAGGDTASASIAVTDPYAAGRLVARLEVALWSEDLAGAVTWTACGLTVRAWES